MVFYSMFYSPRKDSWTPWYSISSTSLPLTCHTVHTKNTISLCISSFLLKFYQILPYNTNIKHGYVLPLASWFLFSYASQQCLQWPVSFKNLTINVHASVPRRMRLAFICTCTNSLPYQVFQTRTNMAR